MMKISVISVKTEIKEINKKNHGNLVLDKFTFRWCDIVFKKEKDKYLIYQIYSDFVPSHR